MNYSEIFKKRYSLFAVIHVKNETQALRQSELAFQKKGDGIFLINHDFWHDKLYKIYKKVRESHSDQWIGLNCLVLMPLQFFSTDFPKDINGLWDDNIELDENSDTQTYAQKVLDKIKECRWDGLYFGGIAFKYQKKVENIEKMTKIASKYTDVITTSSVATGISADLNKISLMAKIAHQHNSHLAVASGITPNNVENYPDADCFLVATGISKDFYTIDSQKLELLVSEIKDMNDRSNSI
ncbi:MAG: BtpA/SgcQ family protein [Promethearchaeati archaeon]